ncbi:alpha/beta fold hydrolase [Pengzhenrongella phosphoraccumulans]|uniref:alpha/beta fold hydrolase n=1 Tax=Pengzhenrongella phosphoraccumulans TaxID=3114394 RepID=UPI00388F84F1
MKQVLVGPEDAHLGYVELEGTDPALVYLHGLGASAPIYFTRTAQEPGLAGRRILMIDFLGFGISDRPATLGYTLEDHADSIARAFDSLGLSRVDVVAHSMGGTIALVLARRRPDLVRRLVLAEPTSGPCVRPRVEEFTEAEFVEHGFRQALLEAGPAWAATMRLADPVAFYRTETALGSQAALVSRDLLLNLAVPCALVLGELTADLAYDPAIFTSTVPIRTVVGAAHCMMLDNPSGFATAIVETLDELADEGCDPVQTRGVGAR